MANPLVLQSKLNETLFRWHQSLMMHGALCFLEENLVIWLILILIELLNPDPENGMTSLG